jgi:hydroxymethylglutaryl-CoA reductase
MILPSGFLQDFSKQSKEEKIKIISSLSGDASFSSELLKSFVHPDDRLQSRFDEFSENTIANFPLPYGIAPNFLINGKFYQVPMVIEESSVVAAASNAAKFWAHRGGFHTRIISAIKAGQVHFTFTGNAMQLLSKSAQIEDVLLKRVLPLSHKMMQRGGGVLSVKVIDSTHLIPNYYQLDVQFNTVDSMGANFINSCLEEMADGLQAYLAQAFSTEKCVIIMSILSNYIPECLVESMVECPLPSLKKIHPDFTPEEFSKKFALAVEIAQKNVSRATTHNKGIMNGVDAVVLATGNDFRAVEAGVHAYAARSGQYSALTETDYTAGWFRYRLTLPLSLGTVGGLTALHPLARLSLELLENPSATELMQIAASAGLANNFSAIRALVTWGIQKGHMMMHLSNILNALETSEDEKRTAREYFHGQKVSFSLVSEFVKKLRNEPVKK